jgi:hypothetical protein
MGWPFGGLLKVVWRKVLSSKGTHIAKWQWTWCDQFRIDSEPRFPHSTRRGESPWLPRVSRDRDWVPGGVDPWESLDEPLSKGQMPFCLHISKAQLVPSCFCLATAHHVVVWCGTMRFSHKEQNMELCRQRFELWLCPSPAFCHPPTAPAGPDVPSRQKRLLLTSGSKTRQCYLGLPSLHWWLGLLTCA